MLDQTVSPEELEPTQCGDCPFFNPSTRSPSCGFCRLHDEAVLGQDKPEDLCTAAFWNLAISPVPTYSYRPKLTVIQSQGSRPTLVSLAMRNGKNLVVSID
ncbi:MAG TPA: hypothetical protein V6C84_08380 [Coleofasciculaceae cyanobacterium]|jgi:hypothetical protein